MTTGVVSGFRTIRDLRVAEEVSLRVDLLLYLRLQQGAGQQLHLRCAAAAEGPQCVHSQVGQQQLGAAVQKVELVLRQGLHRGVTYFVQVENVLQEVKHLVLQGGREKSST